MHTVTDAEHGDAEIENFFVRQRCVLRIHAGRSAGEDDAAGFQRGDLGGGRVVVQDGGIDVALADAARDDLRVLRAEVGMTICSVAKNNGGGPASRQAGLWLWFGLTEDATAFVEEDAFEIHFERLRVGRLGQRFLLGNDALLRG